MKRTEGAIRQHANKLGFYAITTFTEEEEVIIKTYYPIEGSECYKRLNDKTKEQTFRRANKLQIKYIGHIFTKEEDLMIVNNVPIKGYCQIAKLLNLSESTVEHRAKYLGIKSKVGSAYENRWTEYEDEVLRNNYPTIGGEGCAKILTNRTPKACKARANKLGIYTNDSNNQFNWTDESIQILKQYYPIEGVKVLNRLPELNLVTLRNKVYALGLHTITFKNNVSVNSLKIKCVETNEIFNSLAKAAQKYNFSASCFTRLKNNPDTKIGGYHWKYVDEEED